MKVEKWVRAPFNQKDAENCHSYLNSKTVVVHCADLRLKLELIIRKSIEMKTNYIVRK